MPFFLLPLILPCLCFLKIIFPINYLYYVLVPKLSFRGSRAKTHLILNTIFSLSSVFQDSTFSWQYLFCPLQSNALSIWQKKKKKQNRNWDIPHFLSPHNIASRTTNKLNCDFYCCESCSENDSKTRNVSLCIFFLQASSHS